MPVEADGLATGAHGANPAGQLAQHVAGHAVVALPIAPQAAAHRAQANEVAQRVAACEMDQVPRAVDLGAEGGLDHVGLLFLETARAVDTRAVENAFDRAVAAANFVEHLGQGGPIAPVARVVGGCHAGRGKAGQRVVDLQRLFHARPGFGDRRARLACAERDGGLEFAAPFFR